jgi:ribosome maturation factor RimP
MIKKQLILDLAQERINELDRGLFVVDLSISTANIIRLEIDAEEGSVSIDDCIRVSRNIEHNLDREEQDFELSVSSAGLDKPLRVYKQYPKNIGRTIKVKTKEGEKLEGQLSSVDPEKIEVVFQEVVKIEGKKKKEKIEKRIELPFEQIEEAKIVVSFK